VGKKILITSIIALYSSMVLADDLGILGGYIVYTPLCLFFLFIAIPISAISKTSNGFLGLLIPSILAFQTGGVFIINRSDNWSLFDIPLVIILHGILGQYIWLHMRLRKLREKGLLKPPSSVLRYVLIVPALFIFTTANTELLESHYGPFDISIETNKSKIKNFRVKVYSYDRREYLYRQTKIMPSNEVYEFPRGGFGGLFGLQRKATLDLEFFHPKYFVKRTKVSLADSGNETIQITVSAMPYLRYLKSNLNEYIAEYKEKNPDVLLKDLAIERESKTLNLISSHLKELEGSYFGCFSEENKITILKDSLKFLTYLSNERRRIRHKWNKLKKKLILKTEDEVYKSFLRSYCVDKPAPNTTKIQKMRYEETT